MKKNIYIFLAGVVVGSVSTFVIERKRQKLLSKISKLELKLKTQNMKDDLKLKILDVLKSLKSAVKDDKNLTEIERDMILEEVREKIKQIEARNL